MQLDSSYLVFLRMLNIKTNYLVFFFAQKNWHTSVNFYILVSRMRFERMTPWLKVKCSTGWANETFKMAALARFELAHVRVKVWCLTTWLQGNTLVGRGGFEPPNPKEQIYSLPRLATSLSSQKSGAEKRNRTLNLLITSQLLYQLSYFGIKNGGLWGTRTFDLLLVRQML